MARSCGIRIGTQAFELLTLEGSAKKPKLRIARRGRSDHEDLGVDGVADALRELAKANRKSVEADDVRLAVDAGSAVYRHLSLPFADRSKIEDVLKFEVESQIPQWDVDDLVVDFLVTKASPIESELLVTAAPKGALSDRIDACVDAGLEPLDAELESTALYTAAEFCDVLDPEGSTLLIHVAEHASSLVVVAGNEIRSMRALHVNVDEAFADGGVDEEGRPLPGQFDAERGAKILNRLRREILRTLTSSESGLPFTSIHVSGIDLPGLVGEQVEGLVVQRLDPLAELDDSMDPAERARFAVAFGAALRGLGGGSLKVHLRREELAFAGTFERLELPLGVLGLLLLTFLASKFIILQKHLDPLKSDVNMWMQAQRNYTVGQPSKGEPGYITAPSDKLLEFMTDLGDPTIDSEFTPKKNLARAGQMLDAEIKEYRELLGTSTDVAQPMSALTAANAVVGVFDRLKNEGQIDRFALRQLLSEYVPGKRSKPDTVVVKIDFTLWGESTIQSSQYYNDLIGEFESLEWVLDVDRPGVKSLEEGTGSYLQGVKITVDTNLVPIPRSQS